jgi:hypothetical protein
MLRKTTLQKSITKEKKRSANAIMGKKISNSIKEVNKQSKRVGTVTLKEPLKTYQEEIYTNPYTLITTPVSQDYLKRLAREWINMTRDNEDVLFIHEYRVQKEILEITWQRWMNKCPELKEAYTVVKEIIAMRREKGALQNKLNGNIVAKIQCVYSKEWKETEEWRSSLSAKNESSNVQPIQVILESYPSSPLVPVKKTVE